MYIFFCCFNLTLFLLFFFYFAHTAREKACSRVWKAFGLSVLFVGSWSILWLVCSWGEVSSYLKTTSYSEWFILNSWTLCLCASGVACVMSVCVGIRKISGFGALTWSNNAWALSFSIHPTSAERREEMCVSHINTFKKKNNNSAQKVYSVPHTASQ